MLKFIIVYLLVGLVVTLWFILDGMMHKTSNGDNFLDNTINTATVPLGREATDAERIIVLFMIFFVILLGWLPGSLYVLYNNYLKRTK